MTAVPVLLAVLVLVHPLLKGCREVWAQALVNLWQASVIVPAGLVLAMQGAKNLTLRHQRLLRQAGTPFAVLAAGTGASAALSSFPHSAVPGFLVQLSGIGFFALFAATDGPARQFLHRSLLAGGVLAAGMVLLSRLSLFPESLLALVLNPNVAASLALLVLPGLLIETAASRALVPRLLWSGGSALTVLFLLTGGSFMGYLVLGTGAVMVWATNRLRPVPALLMAGCLAFGFWFFRGDWPRLLALETDRLSWWHSGLLMGLDRPVFGQGPGAFGEAYPGFRVLAEGQNSLYAHNFLIEAFAETGVAGAAPFLYILCALGVRAWRKRHDLPVLGAGAGLAGFLLYNLVHIGLSVPSTAWAFWSMAGFLWASTERGGQGGAGRSRTSSFRRRLIFGGIALVWLAAAVSGYRLFRADHSLEQARSALVSRPLPEVEERVQEGLQWNAREPELYSLAAQVQARRGRPMDAWNHIQRALALSPNSARFHLEAGDIAWQLGRLDDAFRLYQRAGQLLPLQPLSWIRRAQIREGQGQLSAALPVYRKARRLVEKQSAPVPGLLAELDAKIHDLERRIAR
jgi:hypothetical protein